MLPAVLLGDEAPSKPPWEQHTSQSAPERALDGFVWFSPAGTLSDWGRTQVTKCSTHARPGMQTGGEGGGFFGQVGC